MSVVPRGGWMPIHLTVAPDSPAVDVGTVDKTLLMAFATSVS